MHRVIGLWTAPRHRRPGWLGPAGCQRRWPGGSSGAADISVICRLRRRPSSPVRSTPPMSMPSSPCDVPRQKNHLPATRRFSSSKPSGCRSSSSCGPWPTGTSWPTRTAAKRPPRSGEPGVTCISRRASTGMYLGSMTLDPISGSIVANELGRIEEEFFKADWARAREEHGGNPSVEDLWRTPAQRRADALVEMAARSSVVQAGGARRPPGSAFQRPRRLADAVGPGLRARRGHRRLARGVGAVAVDRRPRARRHGALRPGRGLPQAASVHRCDPAGHRVAGP